jgi:hypothetical protein
MAIESEPSALPAILLSDLSIVEHGTGKRSIIGCFDQLVFPQFPVRVGQFFATAWLSNIEGKVSSLELTCRIQEKASAHVVFSNSTSMQFGEEHQLNRDNVLALATPIQGVVFPKPGVYTIVLLLDGDEAANRDFNVLQAPIASQQIT